MRASKLIAALIALTFNAPALAASDAATIRRSDIVGLPPHELAARVLGAVAASAVSAKEAELRLMDGPAMTPRWLQPVTIDLPPRFTSNRVCMVQRLVIYFEPADKEARRQWAGSGGDELPATVSYVRTQPRFASVGPLPDGPLKGPEPDCQKIDQGSYFPAPDEGAAREALSMFALFRSVTDRGDRASLKKFTCRTENGWKSERCSDVPQVMRDIRSFNAVTSFERKMRVRTVALDVGPQRQLWLTVDYPPDRNYRATLLSAELIILAPPPPA